MRVFTARILILLVLTTTGPASARIQHWNYLGVEKTVIGAESIVAQVSVADDTLRLVYLPANRSFTLWFSYRGKIAFSKANADRAAFFMRTRRGIKTTGRHSSDYVFKGTTFAFANPDPKAVQRVMVKLKPEDILALGRYERFKEIGVGYFTANELWKTYLFPAKGVFAAYQRIEAEATTRRSKRHRTLTGNDAQRNSRRTDTKPRSSPSSSTVDQRGAKHFLKCSGYHSRLAGIDAVLASSRRRAGPLSEERDQLRSEVAKNEAEAARLQQVASIMRSNRGVQEKYRRAVRRYNEAFDRYKRANDNIAHEARIFDVKARERKRILAREKTECRGQWQLATVKKFCAPGNSKHKSFCNTFSAFRRK